MTSAPGVRSLGAISLGEASHGSGSLFEREFYRGDNRTDFHRPYGGGATYFILHTIYLWRRRDLLYALYFILSTYGGGETYGGGAAPPRALLAIFGRRSGRSQPRPRLRESLLFTTIYCYTTDSVVGDFFSSGLSPPSPTARVHCIVHNSAMYYTMYYMPFQ